MGHQRHGRGVKLAGRRRIALLLSTLSLAIFATPSLANSSQSCMLIRDPAGDASDQPNLTVPGVNQPDLDIVSADIASDARSVTTVVRVQRLGTALEAAGRHNYYRFSFYLGQYGDVMTEAYRGVDGEQFAVTVPNEGDGVGRPELPATGVFDVARNEVRVTIPLMRASGNRIVRKGRYFSQLAADTFRGVGTGTPFGLGVFTAVDHASTAKQYLAGSPSCVQVGS